MPFLALCRKEVRDIMVTLFDQERVTEIHEYNLVRDARQEGREEGIRAMVLTLKKLAADKASIVQELMKQFELLPQTAEEKVERYWNS